MVNKVAEAYLKHHFGKRVEALRPSEKLSKETVKFESPAKGKDKCKECAHFEIAGKQTCEVVLGIIRGADWCDRFRKE